MVTGKKLVTIYITDELNLRLDGLVFEMKQAEMKKPATVRNKITKTMLVRNLLDTAVDEAEQEINRDNSVFYDWLVSG